MAAYYNEHDPKAAAWLQHLIGAGHIAPGIVDTRDIQDVAPDDLLGFTQVHLFAGIGVWSHALRSAGWDDNEPIWTASFPCQPFSAAGKGLGTTDDRHLWPTGDWLIRQCRPRLLVGEQVSSKDGLGWYDIVSACLEDAGYATGAIDLCAAGFGLDGAQGWSESTPGQWLRRAILSCTDPMVAMALDDFADWADGNLVEGGQHIRQRLYWVAHSEVWREPAGVRKCESTERPEGAIGGHGAPDRLADDDDAGQRGQSDARLQRTELHDLDGCGARIGLADADGRDARAERQQRGGQHGQQPTDGRSRIGLADTDDSQWRAGSPGRNELDRPYAGRTESSGDVGQRGATRRAGPSRAERSDTDWLFSTDGKWRAVESGTFPLAHGAPARVGRLRGYGNALHAPTATAFIEAVMTCLAPSS